MTHGWLALPENIHRLLLLGLRRLHRRPPRPRPLRRPPLLPRRPQRRRLHLPLPLLLHPNPQLRTLSPPPGFPLRRVHGRPRHPPHVLPIPARRVDLFNLLRSAVCDPGENEIDYTTFVFVRFVVRRSRHVGCYAGQQDGRKAIKDPEKLKIIASNPRMYTGPPRMGTMREIARMCEFVQGSFARVTASFLTVHGTAEGVTCPSSSRLLYEKAGSVDKRLKMYEGMYHSLIQEEPDENPDQSGPWFDVRMNSK